MARRMNSLEDLKGAIDFTEYYKKKAEEAKPKNMYDLGFDDEDSSSKLSKNKGKHRSKQYTLVLEEEEEEDDFSSLFDYEADSHANKVLQRNKSRRK